MSNQEHFPEDNQGLTREQLKHSGVHGYERPVREYDTPLEEAPLDYDPRKEDELHTSDLPEELRATPAKTKERKPWHKNTAVRIGAAVAGLIAAVGVGVGVTGGSDETAPDQRPGTNASEKPGREIEDHTDKPNPVDLTVENYNDAESLTQAWMAEYNTWMMSGATPETKKNADPTMTRDEYISSIVDPIDKAYISAHYVTDWQSRPQLAEEVGDYTRIHHAVVFANMGTTDSGEPQDIEPYKMQWDLTSVEEISNTGNEIVVEYHYNVQDNSGSNRAAEFLTDTYPEPTPGGTRLTWVQEDGAWKIADHTPLGY